MENIRKKLQDIKLENVIFYCALFLLILSISFTSKYYDYDLWARLIVGKAFLQTGHVLKADFLSYIPTHVWYDHEWGSGVIFYVAYKFLSHLAFPIIQSLLIFLAFVFGTKTMELRGTKELNIAFFVFATYAILQSTNHPVRCQLFSFFFFSVYLFILELARHGKTKWLWITPIIMIIWNNLHGGCVAGIGLFVLYIIGEAINKKTIRYFIIPLVLNILALVINPWGLEFVDFLIMATTMQRMGISEWYGIFDPHIGQFINLTTRVFIVSSLIIESIYIIKKILKRDFIFDATKYLVTATTIILTIMHLKMLFFAVISITVFFYDDIYEVINSLTANIFKNETISKYKNMFIYAAIIVISTINIASYDFKPILKEGTYPYQSMEFLKQNNLKGNILTLFEMGSFASYKLYPNNKIYMDGRFEEVYSYETYPMLLLFLSASPDWKILYNKFCPDIILINTDIPVLEKLLENNEWTIINQEYKFVTLVKTKNLKSSYTKAPTDLNYYKKTLFDTDIDFVLQSQNGKN